MTTHSPCSLFRIGVVFYCAVIFSQALLRAQQVTGTILGTVTDASAAAIANVTVTITDVGTKQVEHTATNASVAYRFNGLPIGTYTVEASVSGFRDFTEEGVELCLPVAAANSDDIRH
jgi:hypothetical protein